MSEFLRSTVRVVRVLRALAVVCLSVSAADLEELMVKPEQNVILKCPSKGQGVMDLLLWTRPDLRPELRPDLRPQQEDVYVFFYRNRRSNELYVDRQYRDRVHLDQDRVHLDLDQDRVHLDQDHQDRVQTGSVSVRLDNVSAEDSGTYECQLKLTGRDAVETHRLKLTVTQPGAPGEVENGYSGLGDDSPANDRSPTTVLIVVVVSVVFVISVAVVCIFLRFGSPNQKKKGKRIPQSKLDACPLSPELI